MKPIFIIGAPASGKSTLGRALARRLGRQFVDLDFYIEQRFRRTIAEMFASEGEDVFRRRESAMLMEVACFENVVIACGGGTPCFGDNLAVMRSNGTIVCLEASLDVLVRRTMRRRSRRPLTADVEEERLPDKIRTLLDERAQFYSQADIVVEGDRLESVEDIEQTVVRLLDKACSNGLSEEFSA